MTKVFIVQNKYEADYTVFFVNNKYEEKNAEIIKGGKIVNNKYEANVKIFIVNNKYEGKILITHENFPR